MRLFQFEYSPFAAKVRRCLELKGLSYETVGVPYLDRRELARLTGGYVHVPVLEDGGTVVTDSARITSYLDARYRPTCARTRSRCCWRRGPRGRSRTPPSAWRARGSTTGSTSCTRAARTPARCSG